MKKEIRNKLLMTLLVTTFIFAASFCLTLQGFSTSASSVTTESSSLHSITKTDALGISAINFNYFLPNSVTTEYENAKYMDYYCLVLDKSEFDEKYEEVDHSDLDMNWTYRFDSFLDIHEIAYTRLEESKIKMTPDGKILTFIHLLTSEEVKSNEFMFVFMVYDKDLSCDAADEPYYAKYNELDEEYEESDFYFESSVGADVSAFGRMKFRLRMKKNVADASYMIFITAENGSLIGSGTLYSQSFVPDTEYSYADILVDANDYLSEVSLRVKVINVFSDNKTYASITDSRKISYIQVLRELKNNEKLNEVFIEEYQYQTATKLLDAEESGFIAQIKTASFFQLGEATVSNPYVKWIYKFEYDSDIDQKIVQLKVNGEEIQFTETQGCYFVVTDTGSGLEYNNYSFFRAKNTLYISFEFLDNVEIDEESLILSTCNKISAYPLLNNTEYINELLAQIEELRSRNDVLSKENASLNSDLQEKINAIQQLVNEKTSLENELNAIILAKQNEIDNLIAERSELQTRISVLESDITSLESSLSATNNNNVQLAADLENVKAEKADLQKRYDEVCKALDGDTSALMTTINKYKSQINEKDKKIKELEEVQEKLEKAIEELEGQQGTLSMGCAGSIDGGAGVICAVVLILGGCLCLGRIIYERKKKQN